MRGELGTMPCPYCGADTDLATLSLIVCTECNYTSDDSRSKRFLSKLKQLLINIRRA